MKRGLLFALVMLLALAMISPGAAMAVRGGNGKAVGHDNGVETGRSEAALERRQARESSHEEQRLGREEAALEREQARSEFHEAQRLQREEAVLAREEAREERVTGQENAAARMGRNLDRMAAKMADGKRKQLPPGLSATWLKFMNSLGYEVTADDLPGSVPVTDTVPPELEMPEAPEGE